MADKGSSRILDRQITTVDVQRRSFLARALGAGALAFGTAATQACGEEKKSDQCDFDIGIDADPTDTIFSGTADPCDTDSTGSK